MPMRPWLVIHARRPGSRRLYGVDVPAMSLELHEWDIHIECFGTDDANGADGAGGTAVTAAAAAVVVVVDDPSTARVVR
jgi:hypothetical protein